MVDEGKDRLNFSSEKIQGKHPRRKADNTTPGWSPSSCVTEAGASRMEPKGARTDVRKKWDDDKIEHRNTTA